MAWGTNRYELVRCYLYTACTIIIASGLEKVTWPLLGRSFTYSGVRALALFGDDFALSSRKS